MGSALGCTALPKGHSQRCSRLTAGRGFGIGQIFWGYNVVRLPNLATRVGGGRWGSSTSAQCARLRCAAESALSTVPAPHRRSRFRGWSDFLGL